MGVVKQAYALGTQVRIESLGPGIHYITAVSGDLSDGGDSIQYGIDGNYWFYADEFEFVEEPTEESFALASALVRSGDVDDDEDDDWSEEDDDDDDDEPEF